MSLCDNHPNYNVGSELDPLNLGPNFLIQDELIWGLSYRNYKKKGKNNASIAPKPSPFDIPFKLCREKQRKSKYKKKITDDRKGKSDSKEKSRKMSLLEKSVMSQSKYMDYLSIPNPKFEEPPVKKRKPRCELEPCPPRLVQLAVPNKRRVFANWKDYHNFLPTEMVMRFEQILHTDKNLEPRDARYYFKKMDKKKRKLLKAKRLLRKKKEKEKQKGDKVWLKDQIDQTIKSIMDFIIEEPLFSLNYKQLMLSDGILTRLDKNRLLRKPKRTSKNYFNRTIIEVCDKVALWMDTLIRFVDVQAIESDEDIPPLTISSLVEEESEGEEEASEASSSVFSEAEDEKALESDEIQSDDEIQLDETQYGEEGKWDEDIDFANKPESKTEMMISDIFKLEEGEGETDLDDLLDELDGDLLEKLIEILGNCSDEFLENLVDQEKMPGVRYVDILDKLKELKDGMLDTKPRKPFLEEVMIEWAMKNEPDKVNQKVLQKIHETAGLLTDWLYSAHGAPPIEQSGEDNQLEDGLPHAEEDASAIVEDGSLDLGEGQIDDNNDKKRKRIDDGEDSLEEADGETEGEEYDEQYEVEEQDGSITDTLLILGDVTGHYEPHVEGLEAEGYDAPFEIPTEPLEETLEETEPEEPSEEIEPEEPSEEIEPDETPQEIDVIYEPGVEVTAEEVDKIIKGHKPSAVFDHSPGTVCCLSLKIWAVWLLEITHNAHNWTKWVHEVIKRVREFAATIRGEIVLPNGQKKVLYKGDWKKFTEETEDRIIAWRQYSAHVKDLSSSIIDNFHGKKVNCCPKCLQDHLIKNVVTAHETLQALTEAMNCASYWQRCLDGLVDTASGLTELDQDLDKTESGDSEDLADFEELNQMVEDGSDESVYEIEELDPSTFR